MEARSPTCGDSRAFGGLFHNGAASIQLTASKTCSIPMNGLMRMQNMQQPACDSLRVTKPGDYRVVFGLIAMSVPPGPQAGTLTVAVTCNGQPLPGGRRSAAMTNGDSRPFTGEVLALLAAGDELGLTISSTVDCRAEFSGCGNAWMIAEKI